MESAPVPKTRPADLIASSRRSPLPASVHGAHVALPRVEAASVSASSAVPRPVRRRHARQPFRHVPGPVEADSVPKCSPSSGSHVSSGTSLQDGFLITSGALSWHPADGHDQRSDTASSVPDVKHPAVRPDVHSGISHDSGSSPRRASGQGSSTSLQNAVHVASQGPPQELSGEAAQSYTAAVQTHSGAEFRLSPTQSVQAAVAATASSLSQERGALPPSVTSTEAPASASAYGATYALPQGGTMGVSSGQPAPSDSSPTAPASGSPAAASKARRKRPTMVQKLALHRRRKQQQAEELSKNHSGDGFQVEGFVTGSSHWASRIFWGFGQWLYGRWLAQENTGLENLPLRSGAFFMASNHLSHLDCGATFIAAWAGGVKKVYALGARDYFFKDPLWAWFVTTFMHVIPFSRRGFSQQEIEALLRLKEMSGPDNPTAILIFPEGTRSKTGSLQQFKAGVGLLAEQLDIPVVPVCVKGTLDALPKGRTIPLRHKIRVQFGKPLEFHDYMPQASPDSAAPQDEGASTSAAAFTGASTSAATPASAPSAATGPSEARGSGAGQGVSSQAGNSVDTVDVERRLRREAQKRFAEDVRASVLGMLGGYGQDRPEEPEGAAHHTPALAQRLGGGKWNLIGWLLYWLPMSACLTVAVVLAASQVHLNGAGMGVAGRLGMGGGYAAAAGVFAGLQGACLNAKVFITLGIVCVAFYLRDFIQWLWPYVVLDCRED